MKKNICILAILLVGAENIYSQHYFLKEKKGLFGYIDSKGVTKIPFQYSFAFTDTLRTIAFVAVDDKIKAIDKDNVSLFTVYNYYNGPDYISDGLFRIVDDETRFIGFADSDGNIIVQPDYFLQPLLKTVYLLLIKGVKWNYLTLSINIKLL